MLTKKTWVQAIIVHSLLLFLNSLGYLLASLLLNLFILKYIFVFINRPINELTITVYSIQVCSPLAFIAGLIVYVIHAIVYRNNFRKCFLSLLRWFVIYVVFMLISQGLFYPWDKY